MSASGKYVVPLDRNLATLIDGLDDNAREYFEERAGILEYVGGNSRAEAERVAWEQTQAYLHLRSRL